MAMRRRAARSKFEVVAAGLRPGRRSTVGDGARARRRGPLARGAGIPARRAARDADRAAGPDQAGRPLPPGRPRGLADSARPAVPGRRRRRAPRRAAASPEAADAGRPADLGGLSPRHRRRLLRQRRGRADLRQRGHAGEPDRGPGRRDAGGGNPRRRRGRAWRRTALRARPVDRDDEPGSRSALSGCSTCPELQQRPWTTVAEWLRRSGSMGLLAEVDALYPAAF